MYKLIFIFLLPLSLQGSIPRAFLFYPKTFSVKITKEELKSCATKTFETHLCQSARCAHLFTEKLLFLPFYAFIHCQAYAVQPCPGSGKETSQWKKNFIQCISRVGCVFTFFPGMHSLIWGLTLRLWTHTERPFVQYLHTPHKKESLFLHQTKPLHVATHNVSFTPSSVNIKMDLRPPLKRAQELAESLLEDPDPPAVLMIEEGWHEEALKILCTKLQSIYPHILHSVAPGFWGMSSGIALFSKHEVEEIQYVRFKNMPIPHNIPPRGYLRVLFTSEKGPLYIYGGVHTHSMCDYQSTRARKAQLKQLAEGVAEDAKMEPGSLQIIMGDMNTTAIDMYGHDNKTQPEGEVWRQLQDDFYDLFLADHDPISGLRTRGVPYFLKSDNQRMGLSLEEPCASWYDGPFLREPEKTAILSQMREDLSEHQIAFPLMATGKGVSKTPSWGTSGWFEEQMALNARLDAILLPKKSPLQGFAEIRRIVMKKGSQSPASDHLRVDALLWLD